MLDLLLLQRQDTARTMKLTILHREGGAWHNSELSRIVNGLKTELCTLKAKPEHVIIFGHHTKEQVLNAIMGGAAFTVKQVIGINSEELPFRPNFM